MSDPTPLPHLRDAPPTDTHQLPKRSPAVPSSEALAGDTTVVVSRHLFLGWLGILLILLSGLVLESLHAFKVDLYLLPESEMRRLLLRLAHAHGGLLSLLHLGYATTLRAVPTTAAASRQLTAGTICLPLGFLLGGVGASPRDPSFGILLVPVGALLLLSAAWQVLVAVRAARRASSDVESA